MDSTILLAGHVGVSLVGILSGFVVAANLLSGKRHPTVIWIFLLTTAATSISGFFFHRDHLLPSQIVGAVALLVMVPTWIAWRPKRLSGAWLATFVVGAMVSLWLNVFVLVAQGFQKIPSLHALAPNGSEPPFFIAEGGVFLVFLVLTIVALRRSRAR